MARFHVRWQTDEPQAVTVPEQALGPQLGDGRVLLGDLLSGLDLLWVKKKEKKESEDKKRTPKTDLEVRALRLGGRLILSEKGESAPC